MGPSTLPSSCAAPTAPSTDARLCCVQRSAAKAIVTGNRAPLAMPCTSRPTTRTGTSPASAVTIAPARKPARTVPGADGRALPQPVHRDPQLADDFAEQADHDIGVQRAEQHREPAGT